MTLRNQIQLIASAFLAAGTVTMLLTAWSIRALGMAQTYVGAMLVFILGSVLGGLANSSDAVFAARVVQGIGAGLMTPLSMVIIAQVFPVSQRGMAMGLMSIGTILAPALGPTLGGVLVDELSWRWVFLIIVPFGAVTLPMALVLLPGREESGRWPAFDWIGTLLCGTFIFALLMAITNSQKYGWNDDGVILATAVGLSTSVMWILWELRVDEPMLELRAMGNIKFAAAVVVTFAVGLGLYGSTYLFPLFLQQISGFMPTDSGIIMAPAGLVMAALFPICGYFSDLVSPRRMILFGMVIFAWASYLQIAADYSTPVATMVWWYLFGRIGLAFIFPSLNAAALNALPLEFLAAGSGIINFMRQLGGAFGVSFVSVTMTMRMAYHRDYVGVTQSWDNAGTLELLRLAQRELHWLGLPDASAAQAAMGLVARTIDQEALMLAYRDGFLFIAVIFTVALLPALFMADRPREDDL